MDVVEGRARLDVRRTSPRQLGEVLRPSRLGGGAIPRFGGGRRESAEPNPDWGLRTAGDDRHGVTGDEVRATRRP